MPADQPLQCTGDSGPIVMSAIERQNITPGARLSQRVDGGEGFAGDAIDDECLDRLLGLNDRPEAMLTVQYILTVGDLDGIAIEAPFACLDLPRDTGDVLIAQRTVKSVPFEKLSCQFRRQNDGLCRVLDRQFRYVCSTHEKNPLAIGGI